MTLTAFTRYLHRHTGYTFYYQSIWDGYTVYSFMNDTLKGYVTEEAGKFYMLTCYHVSNAILTHPSISHKRILQYKTKEYGFYGIYEISIQQDKKPYSE